MKISVTFSFAMNASGFTLPFRPKLCGDALPLCDHSCEDILLDFFDVIDAFKTKIKKFDSEVRRSFGGNGEDLSRN